MNARMSHPPAHRKERDEQGTARRFKTHDQFFTVVDRATCHSLENPYWVHFSGERYFQHRLPIDASSMTRWRQP